MAFSGEKTPTSEHFYYYRASMVDAATFVVGVPQITANVQEEVLQTVVDYNKNMKLGLPHPSELLDCAVSVRMVSWEEARGHKKSHHGWGKIGEKAIMMTRLHQHQPLPGPEPLYGGMESPSDEQLSLLGQDGEAPFSDEPVPGEGIAAILQQHFDTVRIVETTPL